MDIGTSGNDDDWLKDRVVDYYDHGCLPIVGAGGAVSGAPAASISGVTAIDQVLTQNSNGYNTVLLRSQEPTGTWIPSTVYKWDDFLAAVSSMHQQGVANYRLYLGEDETTDTDRAKKLALVNLAAFLAQSMKETIQYNACDENNWDTNYPITSSCGQLGQDYASYHNGEDFSCPRNPKMEITAKTHARWYGAPGPLFTAPDSALAYAGVSSDGKTGYWSYSGNWCDPNNLPTFDPTLQAYERPSCGVYPEQQDGAFVWDGSHGSVEGCGWWGRGVIQTTGRGNFGQLNHYLGRSHLDRSDQSIRTKYPYLSNPLYGDLDFCDNPELICSSTEHPELKWIAELFYWMSSVQDYDQGGWNYDEQLKVFVDGGLHGDAFINSVSGIVNRGCHNPPCSTGPLDGGVERRDNFKKVLREFGLIP